MANVSNAFELKETTDPVLLEDVHNLVNLLWGLRPNQRYIPCPNPSSLERKDLPALQSQEYVVSPKLDGIRLFLLMGALETDGRTYSVFITRSFKVYPVSLKAQKQSLFDGTLLDGELTQLVEGRYRYTAFDAITVEGYNQIPEPFVKRHQLLATVLPLIVSPQGLTVEGKHWYPRSEALQVWTENKEKCDGLILQPLSGVLKHGILADVFKWKPVSHQSIDFYVSTRSGVPTLECGHGEQIIDAREVFCYFDSTSRSSHVFTTDRRVYECVLSRVDDNCCYFTPIKSRTDKTYANDARVVLSTLKAIQEDVTVEELCD